MNQPTLGVVAISYNEELDLPGFINHLITWVDEIVIIDDGSTDNTPQIASSYPDKVNFIQSPRKDGEYYADQRNKGIEAAKSDWLLHMDIDERVSPELAYEIKIMVTNHEFRAYRFRRLNYFLHRPMKAGGWTSWNLVHLAKRDCLRFSGMFHEAIELDVEEQEIGQLASKMHHLNDDSYSERLRKSSNYLPEVVSQIRKNNKKITCFCILKSFIIEFLKKYIYKKGYQDGTPGLIFAIHSASAMFKAYAIVWDEQNRISRDKIENELRDRWKNYDHD